jgi:hypothetical protein
MGGHGRKAWELHDLQGRGVKLTILAYRWGQYLQPPQSRLILRATVWRSARRAGYLELARLAVRTAALR